MGYTHYYNQSRNMTDEEFTGFCNDVEKLHEALPGTVEEFERRYGKTVCDAEDYTITPLAIAPEGRKSFFDKNTLIFNGTGYEGADYESFWVPKKMAYRIESWEKERLAKDGRYLFTKTGRKPYDVMVCACLLALKKHAADAWTIRSDGNVADWASSYHFAVHVLGANRLSLNTVDSFNDDPKALAKALVPTSWLLAQQELHALDIGTRATTFAPRKLGL